jgi:hypothetical protein
MEENLLVIAKETEGFPSVIEMLSQAQGGIQCPAVCKKCYFVDIDVDPDYENGPCDECGNNTVSSVLILAGLI